MTHGWDVVRARNQDNGSSYTTTRVRAEWRGDKILDGVPALDKHGRWRAPTPRKTLTPTRDEHGRFTTGGIVGGDPAVDWQAVPLADHNGDEAPTDEPSTGEEES